MRTGALTPGLAHRAAKAELWVRDMDGRALRPVSIVQAEMLVTEGAAYPIIEPSGTWKEVRLKTVLPPNSLRTFKGRATAHGSPVATFQHNHPACRTWKH
jgi:hypothetical protein